MSDSEVPPVPPSSVPPLADMPASPLLSPLGPSWQEQDLALRDLWLQNKTPQEISVVLNRSVAAIMTRAARLGLPRRSAPGRKPGSSRRMLENGAVEGQYRSAPRPASRPREGDEPAPQPSARICLMCLRSFQSQGRHNRICPSCKGTAEYNAATSLADIHFPV